MHKFELIVCIIFILFFSFTTVLFAGLNTQAEVKIKLLRESQLTSWTSNTATKDTLLNIGKGESFWVKIYTQKVSNLAGWEINLKINPYYLTYSPTFSNLYLSAANEKNILLLKDNSGLQESDIYTAANSFFSDSGKIVLSRLFMRRAASNPALNNDTGFVAEIKLTATNNITVGSSDLIKVTKFTLVDTAGEFDNFTSAAGLDTGRVYFLLSPIGLNRNTKIVMKVLRQNELAGWTSITTKKDTLLNIVPGDSFWVKLYLQNVSRLKGYEFDVQVNPNFLRYSENNPLNYNIHRSTANEQEILLKRDSTRLNDLTTIANTFISSAGQITMGRKFQTFSQSAVPLNGDSGFVAEFKLFSIQNISISDTEIIRIKRLKLIDSTDFVNTFSSGLDSAKVKFFSLQPPVLAFTDTIISGQVGTALRFQVQATDADNDSISFSFTGMPPQGVTVSATGLISGTPTDTGSFSLQVIASNRKGGLDTGMVRLSISTIVSPASVSISLLSGWNLISSNVINTSTRVDSIFSAIVSKVEILKNILGKVYWPRFSVNQIGNWVITEGYWVYMKSADTLKMHGQQANPSTPISLAAGWSIISYLPNAPMSPVRACSTISDKIVIMKDAVGKVYWPRFSVDQIGTMQVGKGYLIYLSSAGTMIYPASVAKEGKNIIVENNDHEQLNPKHFAFVRGTGATATIMVRMNENPVINSTALEIGDEIGIFTTEGLCAGAGVWNGDNVLITAWGDNEETTSIDGFKDGQAYNFKLWDKSADTEKDISVLAESGYLSYSENGLTVVSSEKTAVLPENFVLRQNYPNPFNPNTTISFSLKESGFVELKVYNILGQLIEPLVNGNMPAGYHSVQFSSGNLTSGIYIYTLRVNNFKATKKMIIVK